jgi:anoctamin-10
MNRSDAFKIVKQFRRPVPVREASIGSWSTALYLLSYIGTMSTFALTVLYGAWDAGIDGSVQTISKKWDILVALFLSEHAFLLGTWVVGMAVGGVECSDVEGRRARFLAREERMKGVEEVKESGDADVEYGVLMGVFHSAVNDEKRKIEDVKVKKDK